MSANNWGVFEIWPEPDTAEMHVVPMVDRGDGEMVMSAAHILDRKCPCRPLVSVNEFGVKIRTHHDPEHAGSLTDEQWAARRKFVLERPAVDAVLDQGLLTFAEKDAIQIAFEKFHAENPHVYTMLVKLARQVKERGRKRYGIEYLFARLRWHYDFEVKTDEEFKLNNNFTSRYARLLMEQEKDLEGVFSVRELRRK